MRAVQKVKIAYEDKEAELVALFDTGSNFTVMSIKKFKDFFEREDWVPLRKPITVVLINGQKVFLKGYFVADLVIGTLRVPVRIFLTDEIVDEVEVEGRKIRMPDIIIGSGTMDELGIELHPEKGIIFRGIFLL
ncbi:MAG: hypothetical protein ACTSXJ_09220 [Candidatus Baldrarchaeia archaeon]